MQPQDEDTTQWATAALQDVPRDELQATMEVYNDTILLRSHQQNATYVRTISADEAAHTFIKHIAAGSGLLPKNALWWQQSSNGQTVAIWKAPRVQQVALQTQPFQPPERLTLPMPGLVFVCSPGRAPWVFAAKQRPSALDQQLFRAPAFNVFQGGRVCPGSHRFPDDVELIPNSFFQSFFSPTGDTQDRSRKHPHNLLNLWKEINGKTRYPAEDLVAQCTVAEAMEVSQNANTY